MNCLLAVRHPRFSCAGAHIWILCLLLLLYVYSLIGIVIKNNEWHSNEKKFNEVGKALYVGIGIFLQRNSNLQFIHHDQWLCSLIMVQLPRYTQVRTGLMMEE